MYYNLLDIFNSILNHINSDNARMKESKIELEKFQTVVNYNYNANKIGVASRCELLRISQQALNKILDKLENDEYC